MADTDPTNSSSALRIWAFSKGALMEVSFQSSSNRLYTLFYTSNLASSGATDSLWNIVPGQNDLPGNGGALILQDTNATPPRFYRVQVRKP